MHCEHMDAALCLLLAILLITACQGFDSAKDIHNFNDENINLDEKIERVFVIRRPPDGPIIETASIGELAHSALLLQTESNHYYILEYMSDAQSHLHFVKTMITAKTNVQKKFENVVLIIVEVIKDDTVCYDHDQMQPKCSLESIHYWTKQLYGAKPKGRFEWFGLQSECASFHRQSILDIKVGCRRYKSCKGLTQTLKKRWQNLDHMKLVTTKDRGHYDKNIRNRCLYGLIKYFHHHENLLPWTVGETWELMNDLMGGKYSVLTNDKCHSAQERVRYQMGLLDYVHDYAVLPPILKHLNKFKASHPLMLFNNILETIFNTLSPHFDYKPSVPMEPPM